jgi:hypothetical protein
VLADRAVPRDNFDTVILAAEIKDAEEDVADTADGPGRDKLAQRLDQLKSLQAALSS